jgi:hypothetical protein
LGSDSTSPYSFLWDNPSAGNYSLNVKATDNNGAVSTSSSIDITISIPNAPPSVIITSPTINAYYESPQTIIIEAQAVDIDGTITKVNFYNQDKFLGTDSIMPYTFLWNNVTTGNYSIKAKAYDDKGDSTTSMVVPVVLTSPVAFAFTSFSGTSDSKYNLLAWSTTNCKNTSYFKVLRGQRRMSMKQIGKVVYVNNNLSSLDYSFTDTKPYSGTNYYKIAAVDIFGKVITSNIITISTAATTMVMEKVSATALNTLSDGDSSQNKTAVNNRNILSVKLGPNPVNNVLSVFVQGIEKNRDLKISILSINGITIKSINSNTLTSVTPVDVSNLNAGMYLVQAISGDKIIYEKFVKQ